MASFYQIHVDTHLPKPAPKITPMADLSSRTSSFVSGGAWGEDASVQGFIRYLLDIYAGKTRHLGVISTKHIKVPQGREMREYRPRVVRLGVRRDDCLLPILSLVVVLLLSLSNIAYLYSYPI
jgi:hypothetical protein